MSLYSRFLQIALPMTMIGLLAGRGTALADRATRCDDSVCGELVRQCDDHLFVLPNGSDDSANLECALGLGGTIRLAAGTFYVSHVISHGFVGKLRGSGIDETTITNVGWQIQSSPLNWQVEPPSAGHPWPSLFNLIDGDFTISDLSVKVTGPAPMSTWSAFGVNTNAVCHVFSILGDNVRATIRRVHFEGEEAPGQVGFNLMNGIDAEGLLGWSFATLDLPPLAIDLKVHDSSFTRMASGVSSFNITESDVDVVDNTFREVLQSAGISNAGNSHYRFARNEVHAFVDGWVQRSGLRGPVMGLANTSIKIVDNSFFGAPVVFLGPFGEGVHCRIARNHFTDMHENGLELYLSPSVHGCRVSDVTNYIDDGTDNTFDR
jgi:hypothetical protein